MTQRTTMIKSKRREIHNPEGLTPGDLSIMALGHKKKIPRLLYADELVKPPLDTQLWRSGLYNEKSGKTGEGHWGMRFDTPGSPCDKFLTYATFQPV